MGMLRDSGKAFSVLSLTSEVREEDPEVNIFNSTLLTLHYEDERGCRESVNEWREGLEAR